MMRSGSIRPLQQEENERNRLGRIGRGASSITTHSVARVGGLVSITNCEAGNRQRENCAGAPPRVARGGREIRPSRKGSVPGGSMAFLFTGWRKNGAWPQNWGKAPTWLRRTSRPGIDPRQTTGRGSSSLISSRRLLSGRGWRAGTATPTGTSPQMTGVGVQRGSQQCLQIGGPPTRTSLDCRPYLNYERRGRESTTVSCGLDRDA